MNPYFDNAATTPMAPEVLDAMMPYLKDEFGNPSSTHARGRAAKSAIELSRKALASLLDCEPSELVFTASGSEADNAAIFGAVRKFNIDKIICNPLEHHAVLHAVEAVQKVYNIQVSWLRVDKFGQPDLGQLSEEIASAKKALVVQMYANNELGILAPMAKISELCEQGEAFFLSDLVQGIGHYHLSLSNLGIQYGAASAHKFHGPKGVGLLYHRSDAKIDSYLFGGGQERGLRAGTENVAGIVGMTAALKLCYEKLEEEEKHIRKLRDHIVTQLENRIPEAQVFVGRPEDQSLYSLISLSLPASDHNQMLLFNLDLKGIAVSGGSACSSGALESSHVLAGIGADLSRGTIRVSLSRYNTLEEVEYLVNQLELFLVK